MKELETAKVVRFLQQELRWQMDWSRGGIFENNKTFGMFFFICFHHDPFKTPFWIWAYTMLYYPKKEKQFSCKCGVEFTNIYEVWSKEKEVDLETATKEVDYLMENFTFNDDYEQLPQFKPSSGGRYRIKKELFKKTLA